MPTIGNKTLSDLVSVEKELQTIAKGLQSQTSMKAARKQLETAKNIAGAAISNLPATGDSTFSQLKKSLIAIMNTLSGLHDGLAEGISRTDFKNAVGKLKTRFIPKFREDLDKIVKKAGEDSGKLNANGVLQSDDAIYEDLNRVLVESKKLARQLSSALAREDNTGLDTALSNRLELIHSVYGSMPKGKDLDEAVATLEALSVAINSTKKALQTKGSLKKGSHVSVLEQEIRRLEKDMAMVQRKMRNNIFTYGDERRKPLSKVKEDKHEKPIARSPDQFLKDKITDIKGERSKLPKRLSGPYGIFRSPVVAIFDSHDDIAKRDRVDGPGTIKKNFGKEALLDQFGVKYVMLEDYLILQDQRLLAIDRKAVDSALSQMKRSSGRAAKRKGGDPYLEYAEQVVQMLNERGSQSFDMVSRDYTANPRNSDMLLFWVMPSRILDALVRRGWNKLSQWSLPFDN